MSTGTLTSSPLPFLCSSLMFCRFQLTKNWQEWYCYRSKVKTFCCIVMLNKYQQKLFGFWVRFSSFFSFETRTQRTKKKKKKHSIALKHYKHEFLLFKQKFVNFRQKQISWHRYRKSINISTRTLRSTTELNIFLPFHPTVRLSSTELCLLKIDENYVTRKKNIWAWIIWVISVKDLLLYSWCPINVNRKLFWICF